MVRRVGHRAETRHNTGIHHLSRTHDHLFHGRRYADAKDPFHDREVDPERIVHRHLDGALMAKNLPKDQDERDKA